MLFLEVRGKIDELKSCKCMKDFLRVLLQLCMGKCLVPPLLAMDCGRFSWFKAMP